MKRNESKKFNRSRKRSGEKDDSEVRRRLDDDFLERRRRKYREFDWEESEEDTSE
jgi:hypothetical protein